MRALVVYESLYGNTALIAEHIARGLRDAGFDAEARALPDVPVADVRGVDLLVVGGPTHAHGMSSSATRKGGAADKKNAYDRPTVEPGLRGWLPALPDDHGPLAAAFDTRFDRSVVLVGSAAKGIAKRLEAGRFRLVAPPESFFVTKDNVLVAGQLERATAWGTTLANAARFVPAG
jgi:Flavodoxin